MCVAAQLKPVGKRVSRLVVCLLAGLLSGGAWSAEAESVKIVDDVRIILGLLPSEMVRGHPREHAEASMHGGSPDDADQYHVLIALFDAKSNAPIRDAVVRATVSEPGLPGREKRLDPMTIGETLSYGNYFDMTDSEPHIILVRVERPQVPSVIEVQFERGRR